MRSPPLRHATLELDDDHHAHFLTRSVSTSARVIPESIGEDSEPVDVKDLYWVVQDDRDRRLRLLIRRYVNQIQRGCYNRNCTVTTCLSFRKRNTKGPLRPYTDLSARALACHLVQEYSQAGKDPSSGLCHSPPVVPFYQDPTSRLPTKTSTQRSLQDANRAHADSQSRRPSGRGMNGDVRIPSRVSSDQLLAAKDTQRPLRKRSVESKKKNNAVHVDHAQADLTLASHPRQTESVVQEAETAPVSQKKDPASFVQSLWDTLSLRRLQNVSPPQPHRSANNSTLASDQNQKHTSEEAESSKEKTDIELQSPQSDFSSSGTYLFGYTLNRLRWQTLTWFVNVRNESHERQNSSLDMFVRQSLHHCLRSPQRLFESAQSWHVGRETNHVENESFCMMHEEANEQSNHPDSESEDPQSAIRSSVQIKARQKLRPFNINRSLEAFDMLATLSDGTDYVYTSLHTALQQCYSLGLPRSPAKRHQLALKSLKRAGGGMRNIAGLTSPVASQNMSKSEVAEVFLLILMATLMPLFSEDFADAGLNPMMLGSVADMRNGNGAYLIPKTKDYLRLRQLLIDIVDHFEDWHLLRLTTSLMDCLSHHLAANAIQRNQRVLASGKLPRNILETLFDRLCEALPPVESEAEIEFRAIIGLGFIEVARSVIMKEWDREPLIRRTTPVGGALEFLAAVHRRNSSFYVGHSLFYMPFIAQCFDEMELPVQWLSFSPSGKETHILSFSFLFEPSTLVKYFRAINVNSMRRSHESAATYTCDARQFLLNNTNMPVYGGKEVLAAMRPHMAKYLVLTIRRSNILEDAVNQLWRRQRREIMRPLRVMLGKDEGEDGLDHGGVQQEFFRLVFAEAFEPGYGMFTVDSNTRMTWFQPGSLEPLYKFEALGILMSLAVYNAVTLPITFPRAFYRKLLGLKVKHLEHIKDGWPDLAKGLQGLLDHAGDVSEDIGRTYEFSYAFLGSVVTVDMQKHNRDDLWPPIERSSRKGKEKAKSASFELPVQLDITPPSQSPPAAPLSCTSSLKGISTPLSLESEALDEASTVTNDTRTQYIKDYIFWLTDKSIRPQFEAFSRGFFTCLDPTALSIFTPEALQTVIEGHRDISIDALERTATYEDYTPDSAYIQQLWTVIRDFSPQQHRELLEFVTASDRVPVNGLESIQFIIQKNGEDDARLPSSSTCYGRLLLPEYSSKEILREKLGKALENSIGFGAL